MRVRSLLVVASVASALLVSGAVTGTTLARWQDTAPLPDVTLKSGSMRLSVNDAASFAMPAFTGLYPGKSITREVTLRNASPGTVPVPSSTRANVWVSGTQIENTALAAVLTLRVGAATTCDATVGTEKSFTGYTTSNLTASPLEPGDAVKVCITLKLADTAPTGVTGATGNLSITFASKQVRP